MPTVFDQIIYAKDAETAAEIVLALADVPDDLCDLLYQTASASGYADYQRINAFCAWLALDQDAVYLTDAALDRLVALLQVETSLNVRRFLLAPLVYMFLQMDDMRAHFALYTFYQRGAQQADEVMTVAREMIAALSGVTPDQVVIIPLQPPSNANLN